MPFNTGKSTANPTQNRDAAKRKFTLTPAAKEARRQKIEAAEKATAVDNARRAALDAAEAFRSVGLGEAANQIAHIAKTADFPVPPKPVRKGPYPLLCSPGMQAFMPTR